MTRRIPTILAGIVIATAIAASPAAAVGHKHTHHTRGLVQLVEHAGGTVVSRCTAVIVAPDILMRANECPLTGFGANGRDWWTMTTGRQRAVMTGAQSWPWLPGEDNKIVFSLLPSPSPATDIARVAAASARALHGRALQLATWHGWRSVRVTTTGACSQYVHAGPGTICADLPGCPHIAAGAPLRAGGGVVAVVGGVLCPDGRGRRATLVAWTIHGAPARWLRRHGVAVHRIRRRQSR